MDNFIKSPVEYKEQSLLIKRTLEKRREVIDNLIELIVFTPRGSFPADADFGFEYWNHEYSNINIRDFNNGQISYHNGKNHHEATRQECQDSIKRSIESYDRFLKQVNVVVELRSLDSEEHKDISSKYEVIVTVSGTLDDGLGTITPYQKEISFLMEPIMKRYKI